MKPSTFLFWAPSFLVNLVFSTPLPRQPIVNLGYPYNVSFTGHSANEVDSFLNIRFGQDTSGNNRFAPPKPFTYRKGSIVDASRSGAACPQQMVPVQGFSVFDNVTDISEDCLTLRVDRPAKTSSSAKLPVMVYIYGGGDTIGQIYDSAYDPTMLVSGSSAKGFPVIYVAMNYRLGLFGFAATPELNATDSLNAGLLDQRLALSWVRDHISAFGGDPESVTIFGESDGATGVGLQITAYGGKVDHTPFKRAIMQSGGPTADPGTASNLSAIHTAEVIKMVNCALSTSAEELACLRTLPLSTLLSAAIDFELGVDSFGGFDVFIPTSPSSFIPESPSTLLMSGSFAHSIEIITGWNEDDGSLFVPTTLISDSDVAAWISTTLPGLPKTMVQAALALYPTSSFPSDAAENVTAQYFRASQMMRDFQFACPSLLMIQANANHSTHGAANYIFALNQTIFAALFAEDNTSYYGVSHFSDIPYVFDQATTRYADQSSPSDIQLSSKISGSWASFAAYGNPSKGSGTISGWTDALGATGGRSSGTHNYNVRVLGGPDARLSDVGDAGTYHEELVQRCAFWNSKTVLEQMAV